MVQLGIQLKVVMAAQLDAQGKATIMVAQLKFKWMLNERLSQWWMH